MTGSCVTEKGKKKAINLTQVAAVFGVLSAVFFSYVSVFDVGIPIYYVICMLGITIPTAILLLRNKKIASIIIVVFLIAFGSKIYTGITPCVDCYIGLYNQFYHFNKPTLGIEADLFSMLLAIGALEVLLSLILLQILRIKKGMLLSVLVMLIPVILAATVGKMPDMWTCFGIMIMGCMYLIVCHQGRDGFPARQLASAAGVFVLLIGSAFLLKPVILEYKETHIEEYEEIKKAFIEVQEKSRSGEERTNSVLDFGNMGSNYAKGGIGKGELDNLANIKPTGEVAMTVTVTERPKSSVYLKAYVGATYTGKKWEKLGSFEFADMISPIGGAKKRRNLMNEPFRRISEGNTSAEAVEMEIQLEHASSEFAYSPYYAEITNDHSVYLDAYIKGQGKKEREYNYYQSAATYGLDDASDLWEKYQEFVKDTYVEEYEELEELTAFCETLDQSSAESVSRGINEMFQQKLYYTREPGKMPEDKDFVEGFLFEKQKGFCVHFASSATLIYRICGIPARYVEGYTISPDEFVLQEDGTYQAVVTDEMAHAWCETFHEELGWQVREHTVYYDSIYISTSFVPSYMEEQEETIPEETEEDEKAESNRKEEEDKKEGTESGSGEGTGSFDVKKVITTCMTWVGMMAAFVLLVIFHRRIRRANRLRSFRIKKDNRGITNIYKAIYEMCICVGLEVSEETERERAAKMAEKFTCLTKEEWDWIYITAEKAAFSGKIVTKEEQKEMYRLYRKLRNSLLKSFTWKKKLWFLYGRAM